MGMVNDIILKGEGVWYRDENGVMHPMSFPPPDSDHENLSHFHINSMTGKPFKELERSGLLGKFPLEIAASITAREMMEQGYIDENGVRRKPATEANALRLAQTLYNGATEDFNTTKKKAGDEKHLLPQPFDLNTGKLHPDYKNNHYGKHVHKTVPTADRPTRTEDGKLINNHPRNKNHESLGQHLESSAFHAAKEYQDRAKKMGLESSIGAQQNVIEPQQITGGVTLRYNANDLPPTDKKNTKYPSFYNDLHSQSAAFGQISPMDIVSVVADRLPDLFVPSTEGGMSTKIMNQLQDMGYNQDTARQMARAGINQLLFGRGKDGSATGLRKVMRNLQNKLGINENQEVADMFHNNRSHFASKIKGDDRGRNTAAIEIMAMLKTAEQLGIDAKQYSMYPPPPKSVVSGWRDVAIANGGKNIDFEALGAVDSMHGMRGKFTDNYDHIHDTFPNYLSGGSIGATRAIEPVLPEEDDAFPPPPPPVEQPIDFDDLSQFNPFPSGKTFQNPGISPTFNPYFDPKDFQYSDDDPMGVIATIMERVQLHEAGGSLLTKFDPMDAYDMHRLSQQVGISSLDVRAVAMSLGDWNIIAKSFNTTHDVVRIIKRACGGAMNG